MKIKDEREELEKMVQGSKESIDDNSAPQKVDSELKAQPTFEIDYDQKRKNCQRKARRMIRNATGLMLSDDMVKENPYLRSKMQVDILSLTGLLYQLEVNEIMQESLMESVRAGQEHPRMYEVFGNLTKTISDINKQLIQTVEAMKMTYRELKGDIKEKRDELKAIGENSSVFRNKEGIVSKGTKDLIKEAKKMKHKKEDNEDIEDTEELKE